MKDQSQYINTMVFAVVAGIISLMLLVLILNASDMVRNYSPYIITVEVGLVLIIGLAIYRIIVYEQSLKKESDNSTNNKLNVDSCPDYWTRFSGNKCINGYQTPGGPIIRIDGRSDNPSSNILTKSSVIDLTEFNNKTIASVCNRVRFDNTKANEIPGPWTDVRSVCDSYRLGGLST